MKVMNKLFLLIMISVYGFYANAASAATFQISYDELEIRGLRPDEDEKVYSAIEQIFLENFAVTNFSHLKKNIFDLCLNIVKNFIKKIKSNEDVFGYIVLLEGEVVGLAFFKKNDEESLLLEYICIAKEKQRFGIGTSMFDFFKSIPFDGFKKVLWQSTVESDSFYEKKGFKKMIYDDSIEYFFFDIVH